MGIGCDQLILIKKNGNSYHVKFYNSDGSIANNFEDGSTVELDISAIKNPTIKTPVYSLEEN